MVQGIIGVLVGAAIFLPVGISVGLDEAHYPMIKTCESLLPRNEHCTLIAVPEKKCDYGYKERGSCIRGYDVPEKGE